MSFENNLNVREVKYAYIIKKKEIAMIAVDNHFVSITNGKLIVNYVVVPHCVKMNGVKQQVKQNMNIIV